VLVDCRRQLLLRVWQMACRCLVSSWLSVLSAGLLGPRTWTALTALEAGAAAQGAAAAGVMTAALLPVQSAAAAAAFITMGQPTAQLLLMWTRQPRRRPSSQQMRVFQQRQEHLLLLCSLPDATAAAMQGSQPSTARQDHLVPAQHLLQQVRPIIQCPAGSVRLCAALLRTRQQQQLRTTWLQHTAAPTAAAAAQVQVGQMPRM